MGDEIERAVRAWRRATAEVVASALEETTGRLAGALRGLEGDGPGERLDIPPEVGDEESGALRELAIRHGTIPPRDGILEQAGMTEEEHEEMGR